ncbi:formyltetrahydrofolate deformylase [Chitinophaga jiangningensis]|uniref:Formyltetrahydrofolate deformylase n=1 Tax=Chitinophaga jiangningensis TaxID=1419482 RepID=A0A1M6V2Q6_9BACT|nr:formyltetrahydrofolate deformylase [Chitinophaga jiangningensis]SHK75792.1 formyltetrahydrofolate deformylase [Chitinophaga jiangningensis]
MENNISSPNTARLLISCPDKPGIVATVSQFLFQSGANILDASQHSTDPAEGLFFMRMEVKMPYNPEFDAAFQQQVATPLNMTWKISHAGQRKRMAILVSAYDHCLLDLLWRWRSGELEVDIPLVISNHATLEKDCTALGIPFYYLPVSSETKASQEAAIGKLMADQQIDFIVLARYMQILSPQFVSLFPQRIINIHHSFLPAFAGARPYQHAYNRGVKLIGATAHYVTDELDEGPIIEQDVARVSHKHAINDLVMLGRDIERQVLTRAVKAHIDDRVIVLGNKTIVF